MMFVLEGASEFLGIQPFAMVGSIGTSLEVLLGLKLENMLLMPTFFSIISRKYSLRGMVVRYFLGYEKPPFIMHE